MFSRGSRAHIRPIELGRRLVREMDDQRSVDVQGRRVVPNDFVVQLSQQDFDNFSKISTVLQTELVEAAREYARAEGYHFMGPVRVELAADDERKPGRFDVLATLRQSDGAPASTPKAAATEAAPPGDTTPGDGEAAPEPTSTLAGLAAPSPAGTVQANLVLPSGHKVPLGEDTVTVGRLSACTIPIQDANVSRRHAEVRPIRDHYVVVDLGSTNGTTVNGSRIHGETRLSDGDIISFGSTYVRFEAS